jgi:hypothetical protein
MLQRASEAQVNFVSWLDGLGEGRLAGPPTSVVRGSLPEGPAANGAEGAASGERDFGRQPAVA